MPGREADLNKTSGEGGRCWGRPCSLTRQALGRGGGKRSAMIQLAPNPAAPGREEADWEVRAGRKAVLTSQPTQDLSGRPLAGRDLLMRWSWRNSNQRRAW